MARSRTLAGIAAIFFAAAAQATPDGSLTVSRETRAALGGGIVDFAAKTIVNQPALPVISEADCGKDGKIMPAFALQFTHAVWNVKDACVSFSEANWKSAIGRYEYSKMNKNENAIFMLDLARSVQDIPQIMGQPELKLDLPGTAQDWNAFFLFHELQHSRDHINGVRVAETAEYNADLGAREYYRQAWQQGVVSDPGVPDAMRALRVIESVTKAHDDDTHNIAVLAGLPGVEPDAVRTPASISQSIGWANAAIYKGTGFPKSTVEKAVSSNPHLLYQAARKLYLKGAFDHDPVQKAYAGEFIRAAEAYGADYFKTGNNIAPAPASGMPGS